MEDSCMTPEDMDKYVSENWNDLDIEELTKEEQENSLNDKVKELEDALETAKPGKITK